MESSEVGARRMLNRIVCHLKFDHQQDWIDEIGEYDYSYADRESEVQATQIWKAGGLGDELPEPRHLLQFVRAVMIENKGNPHERASRVMLYYHSSLGLNDESTFEIQPAQIPRSATDIVSPLLIRPTIAQLEAHDIFNPEINEDLLRECKARYKMYLLNAPYMLKKDSFVLLWAVVLWAPENIKGILEANGILCELDWLKEDHMVQLFQMYRKRTWESAGMHTVRRSYIALRNFLNSAHDNEDIELTRPARSVSSEDVQEAVEEADFTSSRHETRTQEEETSRALEESEYDGDCDSDYIDDEDDEEDGDV